MLSIINRCHLACEFLRNYEVYLAQYDGNQRLASEAVFRNQAWQISISEVLSDQACYLIYSDHHLFVDSCAANLVIPDGSRGKRIVNQGVARIVGKRYLSENFPATSRFRWHRCWRECDDAYTRFYYLLSASWFGSSQFELNRATEWIRVGNSLIIFPSGVFGRAKWRQGIGLFVMDYLNHPKTYRRPLYLVSLNTHFCFDSKRLSVDVNECLPATEFRLQQIQAINASGSLTPQSIAAALSQRHDAPKADRNRLNKFDQKVA